MATVVAVVLLLPHLLMSLWWLLVVVAVALAIAAEPFMMADLDSLLRKVAMVSTTLEQSVLAEVVEMVEISMHQAQVPVALVSMAMVKLHLTVTQKEVSHS